MNRIHLDRTQQRAPLKSRKYLHRHHPLPNETLNLTLVVAVEVVVVFIEGMVIVEGIIEYLRAIAHVEVTIVLLSIMAILSRKFVSL
jgi:hypothetical protein